MTTDSTHPRVGLEGSGLQLEIEVGDGLSLLGCLRCAHSHMALSLPFQVREVSLEVLHQLTELLYRLLLVDDGLLGCIQLPLHLKREEEKEKGKEREREEERDKSKQVDR